MRCYRYILELVGYIVFEADNSPHIMDKDDCSDDDFQPQPSTSNGTSRSKQSHSTDKRPQTLEYYANLIQNSPDSVTIDDIPEDTHQTGRTGRLFSIKHPVFFFWCN